MSGKHDHDWQYADPTYGIYSRGGSKYRCLNVLRFCTGCLAYEELELKPLK